MFFLCVGAILTIGAKLENRCMLQNVENITKKQYGVVWHKKSTTEIINQAEKDKVCC